MDLDNENQSISRSGSSLTVSSLSNLQSFQMNPAFERIHARKRVKTVKSPKTRYYYEKMDTNWTFASQTFSKKENE